MNIFKVLCFVILYTTANQNVSAREFSSISEANDQIIQIRNLNILNAISNSIGEDQTLSSEAKKLEIVLFEKAILVQGPVRSRNEALRVMELIFAIAPEFDVYNEMIYQE